MIPAPGPRAKPEPVPAGGRLTNGEPRRRLADTMTPPGKPTPGTPAVTSQTSPRLVTQPVGVPVPGGRGFPGPAAAGTPTTRPAGDTKQGIELAGGRVIRRPTELTMPGGRVSIPPAGVGELTSQPQSRPTPVVTASPREPQRPDGGGRVSAGYRSVADVTGVTAGSRVTAPIPVTSQTPQRSQVQGIDPGTPGNRPGIGRQPRMPGPMLTRSMV